MFDIDAMTKFQNKFHNDDEVWHKIYQASKKIKESYHYNEIYKEKEYIILWEEPFMSANVRLALYHHQDTGWFLRSDVWCRKPNSLITPILEFNEEKIDEWIVEFVLKYKLYESDKELVNSLMNNLL
ncbi:MAG: hypothetical protein E7527_04975 [Ruminococcaceae bacterium]|nr:hypothetical protein [Oscillospiraceae bacterium]